jgi:hypothetical protein
VEPRCIQKLLAIEEDMLHELKEEIANEQTHNRFTN